MKQFEDSQALNGSARSLKSDSTIALKPDHTKAIALSAMCLALFMTNFEGTAMDVALPQIQKTLGANVTGLQWVLNGYLLPVASLLLTSGKLGDIFGRRWIFLLGLTLFTLASVVCGFAPDLELLLAGRVLQGVGAAALIPLSLTIVIAMFPDLKERTKAIGIWSAVSALAMVAGPGLGGLLVDGLGWRTIFLANVPLGVMALIMTIRGVKQDRNQPKQPLDLPGMVLSIMAIASLTCALTEGSNGAWLSPHGIGLLAVSGFSFLGFWFVESRSRHPIIPLSLLRNQTFIAIISTQTLVFFTSGGMFFILSLFLQQVQGYSAAATGLCFLPMNGAIILAAFSSGWVAARLGWRFPIISGLVMASIAILALTHTHIDTKYGEILWYLVLSGFGGGLTIAPLATAGMNSVLPDQEGIASAVSSISIQFGGILGIAIQGAILSQQLSSKLRQFLSAWNVPSESQDKIIANALHGLTKVSTDIPPTLSPLVLQQEIRTAFVSGLQVTLLVASLSMLVGIGVILFLVPAKLKPRSQA
ncbi:MAG: DHA2 family efflux MFS transporter permease subunit [Kovacikia sp.]